MAARRWDVVRFLLTAGVDPNLASLLHGDTPLHAACRCGAPIEVLDVLLQANPQAVLERDYEGLTPLLRLWVRYFEGCLAGGAVTRDAKHNGLRGEQLAESAVEQLGLFLARYWL